MKHSKRILALVLAAVLCMGLFCLPAGAATKETVEQYGTYVSFGDSIPAGYGPYNRPIKGFARVDVAFPAIVADAVGSDDFRPLAHTGFRTEELRYMLERYYTGDEYLFTISKLSEEKVAEMKPQFQKAVQDADLITLEIGSNDVLNYTFLLINRAMADDDTSESELAAQIKQRLEEAGSIGEAMQSMLDTAKSVGKLPKVIEAVTSGMSQGYLNFVNNFNAICRDIYNENPDVTLVVCSVYNPLKTTKLTETSLITIGRALELVTGSMNTYMKNLCRYKNQYKFADISDTPIYDLPALTDETYMYDMITMVHPTVEGHQFIADQIFSVLPERSADDPQPTATPTSTATPTPTAAPTPTPTATAKPTPTPTATPAPTAEPTATPAPTVEPTVEPTASPEPVKQFPFTDVAKGSWYYPNIYYVWDNGIMDGMGGTIFAPEGTTTRAQFAAVIYRMAGKPDASNLRCPFTDLTADWYKAAVAWCYNNGVVNGTSETTFEPDANITREQMVAMLYRYSKATVSNTDAVKAFSDAASISEYAVPAVAWAVQNQIVNGMGDGAFAPQGLSTRAQLAAVLNRYMELKK